jgi:hypothetical protein
VTIPYARVILRQYRFELSAAVLVAVAVGLWALTVGYRLHSLGVPTECIEDWLILAGTAAEVPGCSGPMREWADVLTSQGGALLAGEGAIQLSITGVLPFVVGLLGGVPIVARELEERTAQTAWSLNGSRTRWIVRQVIPVSALLLMAVGFASFAVGTVVAADIAWGVPASSHIGDHGLLLLLRASAAFGIGLSTGAILGKTLPAFVVGIALALALVLAADAAHDAWLGALRPQVIVEISPSTGELVEIPRTITTGWGVRTPNGEMISFVEARGIVTAGGGPEPDPNDPQDNAALVWLEEHGYALLPLGVTDDMAMGWAAYDAIVFGFVGVAAIGSAIVVVNRRRPT